MRRSKYEEVSVEINDKAALEDVGQNADLYIANQELGVWPALSFGYRQMMKL